MPLCFMSGAWLFRYIKNLLEFNDRHSSSKAVVEDGCVEIFMNTLLLFAIILYNICHLPSIHSTFFVLKNCSTNSYTLRKAKAASENAAFTLWVRIGLCFFAVFFCFLNFTIDCSAVCKQSIKKAVNHC